MDAEEFKAWSDYMKARRGTWTIDPVHDGVNRDLIAFISDRDDHTKGTYVCAHGATIEAGFYSGAHASITDGMFEPQWGMSMMGVPKEKDNYGTAAPAPEIWKLVIERLGVPFLLGTTCGVPGR